MAVRDILPALVVAGALVLAGCGSSDDAAPAAAGAGSAVNSPTPRPTAVQPVKAKKTGKATAAPAAAVAPEVVEPTTTDAVSRQSLGGWQGATLAGLRQLDPRLVTDEKATLARVRSACEAFSSGLFQAKAVELVRKKFSTATLKLNLDEAELVYQVILREACYPMSSST